MIKKKNMEIVNENVNEAKISTKAKELLNNELFQSMALNEISSLSRSVSDLENTMQAILKLLQEIMKFEIGLILLAEEKNMLIFSKEKQTNENNEKVINAALNSFNEWTGQRISVNELKMKIIGSENISTNAEQAIHSLMFSEIYAKNIITGILLIGSYQENAYSDMDSKFLNSFVSHASIVMDNARLYQKLESLTVIDELTKVYNKRYLTQIIPQELNRIERYRRTLSIIMFDIDFFKKVNDIYGCIQGDIILKEVAKIALVTLRKVDTLIRYSENKFIILLPEYKEWIEFLKEEFLDVNSIKNRGKILKGNILHEMLSVIENLEQQDLDNAIKKGTSKARILFPHITDYSEFSSIITKLVKNNNLRKFFYISDGKVYLEKDIVDRSGNTKRIDRLIVRENEVWIVEYKTKSESSLNYKEQIHLYIGLVKELFPGKITKGFAMFLEEAEAEEVA